MSLADELRQLAELRDAGAIDEREFAAAKQRLLADSPSQVSASVAKPEQSAADGDRPKGGAGASPPKRGLHMVFAFAVLAVGIAAIAYLAMDDHQAPSDASEPGRVDTGRVEQAVVRDLADDTGWGVSEASLEVNCPASIVLSPGNSFSCDLFVHGPWSREGPDGRVEVEMQNVVGDLAWRTTDSPDYIDGQLGQIRRAILGNRS